MRSVWRDEPTVADIASAAAEVGLVDFDAQKAHYLSVQLEAVFAGLDVAGDSSGAPGATLVAKNGCKVSISSSDPQIVLTVQLTKDVTWTLKASKCDARTSTCFFSSLCVSELANHSYLLFQIQQLRKAVRVKEQYTTYLEENYKTINGTELMDKYKRDNPDEKDILDHSFLDTFAKKTAKDYQLAGKNCFGVASAVKDRETWINSDIRTATCSDPEISETKKSSKRARDDEDDDSKIKIKKENPHSPMITAKNNPIVRKRSQLGYIKRRHTPQ